MDDMQQLLMRVLFEVTESRMETRQEFASFRKEVNDRFDRLEGRVDTLEVKFEKLEATVENLQLTVGSLEATVGSLDQRVDNLETTSGSLGASINTLSATIQSLDEKNEERFLQLHEHIKRGDQARIDGEERIMQAIDSIVENLDSGQQIVQKKPTIVFRG